MNRLDKTPPQNHNICIKCGANTVRTADSRIYGSRPWRTRRKHCDTCFHRWTTVEVPTELLHNVEHIMQTLHVMTQNVSEIQLMLEDMRHLAMMEEGKPYTILSRQLSTTIINEDTHGSA